MKENTEVLKTLGDSILEYIKRKPAVPGAIAVTVVIAIIIGIAEDRHRL